MQKPNSADARTIAAIGCEGLTISVPGRTLVEDLQFQLPTGSWLAVLGQNGSGKTRTLMTLAGLLEPAKGRITLLADTDATSMARRVTLVTQEQDDAFGNSVWNNVLLGRYPHLRLWQQPGPDDRALAAHAVEAMDLSHLKDHDVRLLSGGERQRVAIAQAMVQSTPVLLLDEPTSQLDPAHARAVLDVLAGLCESGTTIVSALHDLNVAYRRASHVLLLAGNGQWCFGDTDTMMTEASLSSLYGVSIVSIERDGQRYFVMDQ
ncbi:MAG: ABC transporter ATP-binding protein [Pseudomonadota bacterium]